MLQAVNLRCEYLKNPIGVGRKKPRFGWILQSDNRNVTQVAYELQFSKYKNFEKLLWSTGVVKSDESTHVYYEGPEPESSTRY